MTILRCLYQHVGIEKPLRTQRNPMSTQLPNAISNLLNATPNLSNTSRWNIGHVGSPGVGSRVGHVDFIFFVSISFALGSKHERSFRWNMGLKFPSPQPSCCYPLTTNCKWPVGWTSGSRLNVGAGAKHVAKTNAYHLYEYFNRAY